MVGWFVAAALAQDGGPPPTVLTDMTPPPPAATATLAHDAEGLGVGIILGVPTGLSVAVRPAGTVWYDGALAWSFEDATVHLHADVLYTMADLTSEDLPDMHFPVWVGVGPRARIGDARTHREDDGATLGVRVPFGMSFVHESLPFEGFLEVAPGIGLYPETKAFLDGALGARFYLPPRTAP